MTGGDGFSCAALAEVELVDPFEDGRSHEVRRRD
jgi:hypothetical protein